jgi:hypothetical protein
LYILAKEGFGAKIFKLGSSSDCSSSTEVLKTATGPLKFNTIVSRQLCMILIATLRIYTVVLMSVYPEDFINLVGSIVESGGNI